VVGRHVVEDRGHDRGRRRDRPRADDDDTPVIPGRRNREDVIRYDRLIYKPRQDIEPFFGRPKEDKRLSLRFEKHDAAFLGSIAPTAIKIAIRPHL
jgi:transposase